MKRVWPLILQRSEKGFSVVEVLLAVTIFGFLATGVIGAIIYGRASTATAGDVARANYLAEEGVEAARNIGNSAFSNLTESVTNVGNTNVEVGNDSNVNGTSAYKVTTGASVAGAVTSLNAYVRVLDGTGNRLVQMAIYADSAGVPGAQLGTSAIQTVDSIGWNVFPISGVTVTANTSYWIGFSENGNTIFAYTGVGGNGAFHLTTGYPAPSPFINNGGSTTDKISFYMSVANTHGIAKLSNVWAFSGTSDTSGIYTRKVGVISTGNNRKTVTSTVTWSEIGGSGQVSVTSLLSNWRAAILSWANAIAGGITGRATAVAGSKVATKANFAYVTLSTTTNNLLTVDISNPAAPNVLNTVSLGVTPTNIFLSGDYLFITTSTATNCLRIYSISNPAAPAAIRTVSATGTAACNAIYVNGNYAYVGRTNSTTAGSNEFNVVNVTTPASASIVGGYNDEYAINEIWASGNYAYAARTPTTTIAEMIVMNVTTPTSPTLAGSYNPTGTNSVLTIGGYGNTLYLGYGTTLNSVNITTPTAPASLGTFTAASTIRDIDEDSGGQLVFLGTASTTGEFQVVNTTTPATMTLVKTLDIAGTGALIGVAYSSPIDSVIGASGATTASQQVRVFIKN